MNIRYALPLIALVTGSTLPAHAQKMYRCGSTYQQQPCGGGQEGKVIGSGSGTATSAAPSGQRLHPQCAQRGAAAQKIKWMREAGTTQQQQHESGGFDRDLVADVYSRQGSSTEVRTAVEADCMAERERMAKAAALLEAAGVKTSGGQPGARVQPEQSAATGTTTRPREDDSAAQEAARKARECESMNEQLAGLRDRQREGGGSASMDSMRQQQQKLASKARAAGC